MSDTSSLGVRAARGAIILAGLIGMISLVGCDAARAPGGAQFKGRAAEFAMEKSDQIDPAHNTESYDRIIDNPFQLAARDPLSTFSADVDSASYSNIRRFITGQHQLPPKDAVRIEEMINYFSYTYAPPKDHVPVAIHPEVTACPWNPKHSLLRIGVQTRIIDANSMPPRNFVFLIDTSGSMSAENRLPLLKSSLRMLVNQLTERDRVAMVAYAGSAGLVLPPTPGSERGRILRALDNLSAGGSTNGGEGIQLAYKVAQDSFIPGGLNRVILGTDGDFNVGVTNQGDLTRLIEAKRKTGVYLTALGFGMGNLKDSTLEKLAHYGNGHYAYIDSEREARKLFVEQGAALITVAKDVKFQVEFNPQHVQAYRLIGYENRLLKHEDFNNDQKDAGDLGSGHSCTVLYELVPPGEKIDIPGVGPLKYQQALKPAGNSDEWLTIKLRYKDPEEETSKLLTVPVRGADRREASSDTRFASAVAAFGMLLRESPYKGEASLDQVQALARENLGRDPHGHRREFVELVRQAAALKNSGVARAQSD